MTNPAHKIIWAIGVFHVAFGLFHLGFWRIFQWEKNLACLDLINRSIMQILNLRLTFVFFLIAYACFAHAAELMATRLGNTLLVGFSLFWFCRTLEQLVFFGFAAKPISVGLTGAFLTGGILCLIPVVLCRTRRA
ncbi:MAG: hypothetical protein HY914_23190 [Desulfomonile tiedjei]|nr:hypothetical protein [Desulfomonile tiedjei]